MSTTTSLTYPSNDEAHPTELSSGIGTGDTSVPVGKIQATPPTPYLALISKPKGKRELVEVTSEGSGSITVNRGAKGTTAKSFSSGDRVDFGVQPSDVLDDLQEVYSGTTAPDDSLGGEDDIYIVENADIERLKKGPFRKTLRRTIFPGNRFLFKYSDDTGVKLELREDEVLSYVQNNFTLTKETNKTVEALGKPDSSTGENGDIGIDLRTKSLQPLALQDLSTTQAVADAQDEQQVFAAIDEANDNLVFEVRKSDGTRLSGTVNLS